MTEELTADSGLKRAERILDQAAGVFGSRSEAARWFRIPAIGLGARRPIDLLWTEKDLRLVETLLRRVEYDGYT